jgi:hypothetical protein
MRRIKGSELPARLQREALARFVYRYTGEHRPCWATGQYMPQFRDDQDWLGHTYFYVTNRGEIAKRPGRCDSYPTWPFGIRAA